MVCVGKDVVDREFGFCIFCSSILIIYEGCLVTCTTNHLSPPLAASASCPSSTLLLLIIVTRLTITILVYYYKPNLSHVILAY